MALFSFLKDRRDARSSSNARMAGAQPLTSVSVEEVRARARRRLIGAAVLVMAAVIGLPLVFESKPRTVAVDTPIDVARPDGLPAVSVPAPKPPVIDAPPVVVPAGPDLPTRPRPSTPPPSTMITEAPADAGREVPPPPSARASTGQPAVSSAEPKPEAAKPTAPPEVTRRAEAPAAPKVKPTPKPSEAAASTAKPAAPKRTPEEAQRARALLEGEGGDVAKPVKAAKPAKPAPTEAERTSGGGAKFGVQVGAFAQSSSADAAIGKVADLGLKAHAQEIDTPNGKRIRVRLGPYATREEADRAAQRLRAGGQTAAVVTQ